MAPTCRLLARASCVHNTRPEHRLGVKTTLHGPGRIRLGIETTLHGAGRTDKRARHTHTLP